MGEGETTTEQDSRLARKDCRHICLHKVGPETLDGGRALESQPNPMLRITVWWQLYSLALKVCALAFGRMLFCVICLP
jgi:hypothetical protein